MICDPPLEDSGIPASGALILIGHGRLHQQCFAELRRIFSARRAFVESSIFLLCLSHLSYPQHTVQQLLFRTNSSYCGAIISFPSTDSLSIKMQRALSSKVRASVPRSGLTQYRAGAGMGQQLRFAHKVLSLFKRLKVYIWPLFSCTGAQVWSRRTRRLARRCWDACESCGDNTWPQGAEMYWSSQALARPRSRRVCWQSSYCSSLY